jgi:hypothetical protein
MTSSEPVHNPLRQLVVLMVCLSILGSILGGAMYYTIDLPARKAAPPENTQVVLLSGGENLAANPAPMVTHVSVPA